MLVNIPVHGSQKFATLHQKREISSDETHFWSGNTWDPAVSRPDLPTKALPKKPPIQGDGEFFGHFYDVLPRWIENWLNLSF